MNLSASSTTFRTHPQTTCPCAQPKPTGVLTLTPSPGVHYYIDDAFTNCRDLGMRVTVTVLQDGQAINTTQVPIPPAHPGAPPTLRACQCVNVPRVAFADVRNITVDALLPYLRTGKSPPFVVESILRQHILVLECFVYLRLCADG